ncbi:Lsr2 family protein [Pseudonocardia sp. NPDC049635]|uniref:histone-like nucleoid-structuring protein Lsr2 n=1 Tax=Pseudonocardia sp. NPDC049635 TaxID=3155506 RepID=UPI0033CEB87B
MARIEHITLVDDLDGSSADETVEFIADNVAYEIDLSRAHAAAFREALAPYVAAARRAPGTARQPRRDRTTAVTTMTSERRQRNSAIRSWAREKGYPIAVRGRIPTEVADAYAKAVESGPAPDPRASTPSAPHFQDAG